MPPSLPTTLAILILPAFASAAEFHVSPDGTAQGDGSAAKPWSLQAGLSAPKTIRPGDTILLHAGPYRGGFACKLKGTESQPITIRPAPGRRVTIDCRPRDDKDSGLFSVEGEYAVIRDLEFTCSDPHRITTNAGSFPADIRRGGINCSGSHISFVNLVVHDCSNGIGFWSGGTGGEIYGCLIYNNGWKGADRGHGHGIYTQNKDGTKRIEDNIIFNQFSYGIHAYGSSRAFLRGFHVEGNAIFDNGAPAGGSYPAILVGGGSPAERIVVRGNFTYRGNVQLGYDTRVKNRELSFIDNHIVGQVAIQSWEKLTSADNLIIDPRRQPASPPRIHIRPNRHQPGRANIIVYNPQDLPSVEVDLTDVLKQGHKFRVVSACDFFGRPLAGGVYDGRPVAVSMNPLPAPPPVGLPQARPPAAQPRFAVFVVLGEQLVPDIIQP